MPHARRSTALNVVSIDSTMVDATTHVSTLLGSGYLNRATTSC
jgi:hypothetical protein